MARRGIGEHGCGRGARAPIRVVSFGSGLPKARAHWQYLMTRRVKSKYDIAPSHTEKRRSQRNVLGRCALYVRGNEPICAADCKSRTQRVLLSNGRSAQQS